MSRPLRLIVVLLLELISATAWADAEEVSIGAGAAAALFGPTDPRTTDEPDAALMAGANLQATYATHDWFAYDFRLEYRQSGVSRFEGVVDQADVGDLLRAMTLFRALAGLTGRFGVRTIPTLGLAAGYQLRWINGGTLTAPGTSVKLVDMPARVMHDLVFAASAGFDFRWNQHWVVGGTLRVLDTPLSDPGHRAAELLLEVRYYFYPS